MKPTPTQVPGNNFQFEDQDGEMMYSVQRLDDDSDLYRVQVTPVQEGTAFWCAVNNTLVTRADVLELMSWACDPESIFVLST